MAVLHEVIDTEPRYAVLVGVQLPGVTEFETEQSLDELARLVKTLGLNVVGRMSQKRPGDGGATVLGAGKLKELADWTGGTGVVTRMMPHKPKPKGWVRVQEQAGRSEEESLDDAESDFETDFEDSDSEDVLEQDSSVPKGPRPNVVVFDCELTPSQTRNLESALGCEVMDRTGVIIEIFSRHARTRAARLQVEIARLTYVAPRLRETGGSGDRQGGGIGGKGAGESEIELDRRKIRDRIKELKDEFESIEREHETRRNRRSQVRCVALVGYTNAGKSSMMRALTGSEVLVADKLFATLDTTVRPLYPPAVPAILISDTVGFIKKLPHDLVASFKSTLDEALNASLLLFVVDSSDPSFPSQLEVTKQVLAEVGAGGAPSRLVLNKSDRLTDEEKERLKGEFPDAILMSTKDKEHIAELRAELIRFFEGEMIDRELLVPYTVQGAIGEIRSRMRVLEESFEGDGVRLTVRTTEAELARIRSRFGI